MSDVIQMPPPAAVTQPVPQPVPVQSSSTVTSQPTASSGIPEISPSLGILVQDTDGSTREITLGEMAEAWKHRGQIPSGDDAQTYGLFKKVITDSDPQAFKDLVDKLYPSTPTNTPTQAITSSQDVAQLREQMAQIAQYINQNVNPVVGGINQLAGRQRLNQELTQVVDQYPALKHVGTFASLEVERQINDINQMAIANGVNLSALSQDHKRRVWETALSRANAYVGNMIGLQPPGPSAPNTVVVDDHNTQAGRIPALLQIDPNNLTISMRDPDAVASVVNMGGYGGTSIPRTPVQPVPTGGAPGVTADQSLNKRFGQKGLFQRMKSQFGGMR